MHFKYLVKLNNVLDIAVFLNTVEYIMATTVYMIFNHNTKKFAFTPIIWSMSARGPARTSGLYCCQVVWTGKPCANFHLLICLAILDTEKTTLMENNFGFTEILKVRRTHVSQRER